MTAHDFHEKANQGLIGELIFVSLKHALNTAFLINTVTHIRFDKNNEFSRRTQKEGIDGLMTKRPLTWDVKLRTHDAYQYNDILIETVSNLEDNKKGWYHYSKADLICYGWLDKDGTRLIDMYALLVQTPSFRIWFAEHMHTFHKRLSHTKTDNHNWTTVNICVPISAFPKDSLFRIPLQKEPKIADYL